MSAPPVKRKQKINCMNKRRYPDEITARAVTAHLIDAGLTDRPVLWVYRCSECRGFHLTKRFSQRVPGVTSSDTFARVGAERKAIA